jgi:prepilin peptidase CpaA
MLTTIVLFGFMFVATVTDLTRHKIYNWTTYTGILAAVSLSVVGSLLAGTCISEERLRSFGWIPVQESLVGLLACGLVMLVCFVMFKVGGGDVKLMAMVGAFCGPEQGITVMLWTFVLGACTGLIVLIWRVGPMRTIALAFRRIAVVFAPMWFCPLTDEDRVQLQPPLFLAPSALLAMLMVQFSVADYLMK